MDSCPYNMTCSLSDLFHKFDESKLLSKKLTHPLNETYIISYDQQKDEVYVSSVHHSTIYKLRKLSYVTIMNNLVDISSFVNMSIDDISIRLYKELTKIYGYNEENNCWYCTSCGEFMGENNPRQLCGKHFCHNEYLFIDDMNLNIVDNDDIDNDDIDNDDIDNDDIDNDDIDNDDI